jgi:hypothetical protein
MKVLPKLRVVGVSGGEEIPLTAQRHFAPFNAARLSAALVRLGQLRNQPEQFQSASRNLIQLYENSRRQGLHNDPPLEALRIYQMQWQLDPWARNVDTPDLRQLLVEVTVHGDTA